MPSNNAPHYHSQSLHLHFSPRRPPSLSCHQHPRHPRPRSNPHSNCMCPPIFFASTPSLCSSLTSPTSGVLPSPTQRPLSHQTHPCPRSSSSPVQPLITEAAHPTLFFNTMISSRTKAQPPLHSQNRLVKVAYGTTLPKTLVFPTQKILKRDSGVILPSHT